MKRIFSCKSLSLFFFFAIACTAFVACGDDDDEVVPVDISAAFRGSYEGKMVTTCDLRPLDSLKTIVKAEVDAANIRIAELPVALVVDSVFGSGTADSLGISVVPTSVGYKLYNASASYYPMSYDPQPIELEVSKGGTPHQLSISFYGRGNDFLFYFPSSKRLEMTLRTSSVRVDGEQMFTTTTTGRKALAFRYAINMIKM
ncbi:MAG: DUF4840 domain-containing protein [Alloprevotella sp.]|nr:DUF4840 domain-containing protein [Alloprevotella sp.]